MTRDQFREVLDRNRNVFESRLERGSREWKVAVEFLCADSWVAIARRHNCSAAKVKRIANHAAEILEA